MKEKVVKGMYLVVWIVKEINFVERNVCQILNKTITVVIFYSLSRLQKKLRGLGV